MLLFQPKLTYKEEWSQKHVRNMEKKLLKSEQGDKAANILLRVKESERNIIKEWGQSKKRNQDDRRWLLIFPGKWETRREFHMWNMQEKKLLP